MEFWATEYMKVAAYSERQHLDLVRQWGEKMKPSYDAFDARSDASRARTDEALSKSNVTPIKWMGAGSALGAGAGALLGGLTGLDNFGDLGVATAGGGLVGGALGAIPGAAIGEHQRGKALDEADRRDADNDEALFQDSLSMMKAHPQLYQRLSTMNMAAKKHYGW